MYFDFNEFSASSQKCLFVQWFSQQRACPSIHIPFSMNVWVLAFISTIHDFYPFCKWTFQTTQYVCEHFVEWTCKELFFGICNLAQIVSEICINNKPRIFLIWNVKLLLYLGYIEDTFLVQSSAFITNHIIFLYFSVDKFWNGLTFIGRLLLRCDLPQTTHWYAFGISANTYHSNTSN